MTRRVLILDLKDDAELIAAYEAHHAPGAVPEAIVRGIVASGIKQMDIHRCGNRLIMVIETTADFDPQAKAAADASDPAVIAWEELMDNYQQRLPWAPPGVKWLEAEQIFALSEQPGGSPEAGDSSYSTA